MSFGTTMMPSRMYQHGPSAFSSRASLVRRTFAPTPEDCEGKRPFPGQICTSVNDELVHGERAFRVGAKGYLVKQEATEKVIIAIRKILAGEVYLSDRMQSVLLQKVRGKAPGQPVSVLSNLTDREYEIFRMIGLGLGATEIAAKLNRSVKTVETHRASLKQKLGLRSANDLNRFAATWADRDRV